MIKKVKHWIQNIPKHKIRDSFRLGIQSAIAVSITYVTMTQFDLPEMFVGLLSAVLVVDTSIGHTLGLARQRLLSTAVGSAIGFVCVTILPWGVGTPIALGLSMFIINAVSYFKSEWRYGVVAAVALSLGSENNAMETSVDRLISIAIGVATGILVSFIVWPHKAETRAMIHARTALGAICKRFNSALESTREKDDEGHEKISDEVHKSLRLAQSCADATKFNDAVRIKEILNNIEKLYNSILIIHRVAQRSKDDISDDSSGIKEDSNNVQEQACEIITCMADQEEVSDSQLCELVENVDKILEGVVISDDAKTNVLRQGFVFGITEIRDSIKALVASFKKEDG